MPSLFDEDHFQERPDVMFLHHVQQDMAAAITRDGREHYEYVATQIVAEYFRRVFHHGGRPLDGLMFKSSHKAGGACYCIFATAEQCAEPSVEQHKALLRLKDSRRSEINFAKGSFAGASLDSLF